jgi:hypothetical protein
MFSYIIQLCQPPVSLDQKNSHKTIFFSADGTKMYPIHSLLSLFVFPYIHMFILSELEDTVKIVPNDFKKEDNGAITDVLNEKYANKVVQEVGLCICVHDILETSEGFILYGDGCSYMKGTRLFSKLYATQLIELSIIVTFRLVVFRPFVGEILTGKIKTCSPGGVVGKKVSFHQKEARCLTLV